MLDKNNMATKIVDAGGQLKVKSALNPMLWMCAIVTIPALISISFQSSPPTWLICIICCPVGTAIFGFMFLLFFDRDKLQSEDYQIRKQSLELIQQKGDIQAIEVNPGDVEAIANPGMSILPAEEVEE